MVMHDTLTNTLAAIYNHERIGRTECVVKPASKVITGVLRVMQRSGYIGDFELIDNGLGGVYRIKLGGKISACRTIKPRQSVRAADFEKWERRFLPAQNLGMLILSTTKGIMAHEQARKTGLGGTLLAYVY
jgi:small subunit ribosomal protein S8